MNQSLFSAAFEVMEINIKEEIILEPSSFRASFAAKQVPLDGSSLILQACLTATPDFGSESIPFMKRSNYCNIMPALVRLMTMHC
jgi:hypothetical protein